MTVTYSTTYLASGFIIRYEVPHGAMVQVGKGDALTVLRRIGRQLPTTNGAAHLFHSLWNTCFENRLHGHHLDTVSLLASIPLSIWAESGEALNELFIGYRSQEVEAAYDIRTCSYFLTFSGHYPVQGAEREARMLRYNPCVETPEAAPAVESIPQRKTLRKARSF